MLRLGRRQRSVQRRRDVASERVLQHREPHSSLVYPRDFFLTIPGKIGPEFVAIAFETAALYDPDVKLYYNDYNIESAGAKATSTLNLVRSLQARGVKIDGVGMQAHFIVGSTPILAAQKSNLASFGALGVEIA